MEQEIRPEPLSVASATDNFSLASGSEEEEGETVTVTESATEARPKFEDSITKFLKVLEKNELSREEERKLMLSMMRKRETERLERTEETEQEPIMIDECYHLKDDGNSIIDLDIRLRLTTPNVEPSSYWNKSVPGTRVSKPRKGNNLFTEHLHQAQVAPITIRRMSDRGAVIRVPHLLARNAGVEFSEEGSKRLKVTGRGDNLSVNHG